VTIPEKTSDDAPIFLVGFMASGKTTVGRLLAAGLGWGFVDLDDLVVAAAGRNVPEIFAAEGEPGFRRRELEALRRAAARPRTVVATGGGAVCREEALAIVLDAGRVVALDVSAEEAVRRAGTGSGRPLLDGDADPLGAARRLLEARRDFYRRAHLRIETEGRTPAEIVRLVGEKLGLEAIAGRSV
jgi:shikimate kinase